jgi:hypothetical protein
MQPGRSLLQFFEESDLKPLTSGNAGVRVNLLTASDVQAVTILAERLATGDDITLSATELAGQPTIRMFVAFVRSLGAIQVRARGSDSIIVRKAGRLSPQVGEILSIYLREGFTAFSDWDRTHTIPEDGLSAMELLRQLEIRRIEQTRRIGQFAQPLARRPVAFVIFRAHDKYGHDCYLFEVNKDWQRLNFVGGKQESEDAGNFETTARREVAEELGIGGQRIELLGLNREPIIGYSLSGNAGTLAEYPCVLFGATVSGNISTRLNHRWLTEKTIRDCIKMDDQAIMVNPSYMRFLLDGRSPRIASVPLSTSKRVRSTGVAELVPGTPGRFERWRRVLVDNKDLTAAVILLLGAIISLLVAFK